MSTLFVGEIFVRFVGLESDAGSGDSVLLDALETLTDIFRSVRLSLRASCCDASASSSKSRQIISFCLDARASPTELEIS